MLLNKNNLNIAKLASKEETSRFTLSAIRVTPTETIVTDGYLLMRVTQPVECKTADFPAAEGLTLLDDFKPFNLPAESALKAMKDLPRKAMKDLPRKAIPVLKHAAIAQNGEPGKLEMVTNDLKRIAQYPAVEGSFPDVDRIMPKADKITFTIALDPHKVKALMGQFIGMLGDDSRSRKVVFGFQDAQSACQMEAEQDGQKMTAVLMPVRLDS